MNDRTYTVAEMNRMRDAIARMYPDGVEARGRDREADIEDRLFAHMSAGTAPEDLEAEAERLSQIRWAEKVADRKAAVRRR